MVEMWITRDLGDLRRYWARERMMKRCTRKETIVGREDLWGLSGLEDVASDESFPFVSVGLVDDGFGFL